MALTDHTTAFLALLFATALMLTSGRLVDSRGTMLDPVPSAHRIR